MAPRRPLRILFALPAYWPAVAFGGPVWVARELAAGLTRLGHSVTVVTTTLMDLERRPSPRSSSRSADGIAVTYLGTPLRYRWMGIPPTLPLWLRHLRPRPDVVHLFGFRDVVTTVTAAWAGRARIPYVLEPLGMYVPRFRSLGPKRVFDAILGRHVAERAARVIATSDLERRELVARGVPAERIVVRPNGFPPVSENAGAGALRSRLGLAGDEPLLLYVGRISYKKGLDLLLEALVDLPDAHLALVGPDDHDGTMATVRSITKTHGLERRVHVLGPVDSDQPRAIYADADVFVLPSRNENFGNVAAEAAAAGTPVVLTDRCGVAELLDDRGALVVPCEIGAIRDAVARLLADAELRGRLGAGGAEVAREVSWDEVVRRQEQVYLDLA